jgi:hypothetical protein
MSDGIAGTRSYVGRFGTSIGWAPFQIFMILAATLAKSSAASADLHSVWLEFSWVRSVICLSGT